MSIGRRTFFGSVSALAATQAAPSAAPELEAELLEAIDEIPLVNTHEHIIPEEERTSSRIDFFTLAGHYAISDVISAGLSGDDLAVVRNPDAPAEQRWRAFEPFWKSARMTGYGRALRIAIQDIYGVDQISGATLPEINRRIEAANRPGLYEEILIRRSNIAYSVLDDYWNAAPVRPDPRFFVCARKFDRFVAPQSASDIRNLEELTDVSITGLAGLKRALETSFQQSLEIGMVTVKSTLAYNREILYAEVAERDAESSLQSLLGANRTPPAGFRSRVERPFRPLEDHMFHHLIGLAAAHDVPVQIHTGLHAGNGNFVENSKPTHLTNLFFLFPQVKFDLFHMSYPYHGEAAAIAKVFPNVYVDLCWAHIISPSASRRALHEFLDTVPSNKIFGYGGDYRYPELSYAHAKMARRNISQVLAEKVSEGSCSEEEALELGRKLLHDNPDALFGDSSE
ncbi:MAG: amidohydrolase family protein [Bryobacterales bacterium]|nr:amidohydrolase family protein [Bryobacterales bacterium]